MPWLLRAFVRRGCRALSLPLRMVQMPGGPGQIGERFATCGHVSNITEEGLAAFAMMGRFQEGLSGRCREQAVSGYCE